MRCTRLVPLKVLLAFLALALEAEAGAAPAEEKPEAWAYIEKTAVADTRERQEEGGSFLLGGVVAIALPFLATSSDSALRTVGLLTLVPAGAYSAVYGAYMLATDSPWEKTRKRVETLSGAEEDCAEWRLKREANAREALAEQGENLRFWRYFRGGVAAGAGFLVLQSGQGPANLLAFGALAGVATYHFLHPRADERYFIENQRGESAGNSGTGRVTARPVVAVSDPGAGSSSLFLGLRLDF